jgi:hypothetical protein
MENFGLWSSLVVLLASCIEDLFRIREFVLRGKEKKYIQDKKNNQSESENTYSKDLLNMLVFRVSYLIILCVAIAINIIGIRNDSNNKKADRTYKKAIEVRITDHLVSDKSMSLSEIYEDIRSAGYDITKITPVITKLIKENKIEENSEELFALGGSSYECLIYSGTNK